MIDLHCHVLPALDDGPATLDGSLELARAAEAAGTTRIAATPHIRDDHPFDPAEVAPRAESLNGELRAAGIAVQVLPAGEVAIANASELDDATLAGLCLGEGRCVLVESPYTEATDMLENDLFNLQLRGFMPLLAHPERSPSFLKDIDRLRALVEHGILCSITAASMSGVFGRTIRRFTLELFREGLVHDVASDAHDTRMRSPDLMKGFRDAADELPGAVEAAPYFVAEAPEAILAGVVPPEPPQLSSPGGLRRLLRRSSPRRG